MDHICTWFCADEKGEESIFPQTGQKSSSPRHQLIYWRCLVLFFATSRRYNQAEKHLLFTNVKSLPEIDGKPVRTMLDDLDVQVVFTDFKYKTPKGYFGMFQNQFYEFSILEHIATTNKNPGDNYLIADSDCIFLRPAEPVFKEAASQGFMSFEDDCTTDLVIHGLSRKDMKRLYAELLEKEVEEIPGYHLGEFLLASVKNIQIIFADFLKLWLELIRRYEAGLPKFNEEAQTLSFLYYKNNLIASPKRNIMKRIWTNPVFYRNVERTDKELVIWHLPAEKTYGLADLYEVLIRQDAFYGLDMREEDYRREIQRKLGIPTLTILLKLKYYSVSYYRAILKRAKKKLSTALRK